MYKNLIKTLIFIGVFNSYSHLDASSKVEQRPKSVLDMAVHVHKLASKHKLNPNLILAIIAVESSFRSAAYNAQTQDIGLMQVNRTTARLHGLHWTRLQVDSDYNLESGAYILADFRARYATKEPKTWMCRYNVGSGPLIGLKLKNCLKYLAKLKKVNKGVL